jgi:hypothetical protein
MRLSCEINYNTDIKGTHTKQHEIFEKLDFQFDSPYDRSQTVRVYKKS